MLTGQAQQRPHIRFREQALLLQLFGQMLAGFLDFLHGEFGGVQAARDLTVQIASDDSAERDGEHDPESDSSEAAELERCVEGDDKRSRQAKQDVEVEPVPGQTLAAEPWPFLSEGIEEDHQEHGEANDAELNADGPAGTQQWMLGRKWPVGGTQRVVVEPVERQRSDQSKRDTVGESKPDAMAAIRIAGGRGCGSGDSGVSTHGFWITLSSVLTENFL